MKVEGNRDIRLLKLVGEFDKKKEDYNRYKDCLTNLITRIVESSGVSVHDITSRRKRRNSFINKIEKPGKAYSSLIDVTDIVGLRITTYFENDVDKIKSLIESEFEIDVANSVDKRRLHDPDRFGYMSLHYVFSLKPERLKYIEYSPFEGMKAEIQIRSILQHTWAEIEHDLGYKSKYSIPSYLKRRFSQLSSLLELADREFLEIKHNIEEYDTRVLELMEKEKGEILTDKNSMIIITKHDESISRLDKAICKITGGSLTSNSDYSETLANMLLWLEIGRMSELFDEIETYKDQIEPFAKHWIAVKDYREFNHGISLMYLCYIILAKQGDEDKINDFAKDFFLGEHVDNFGKRVLNVYQQTNSDF